MVLLFILTAMSGIVNHVLCWFGYSRRVAIHDVEKGTSSVNVRFFEEQEDPDLTAFEEQQQEETVESEEVHAVAVAESCTAPSLPLSAPHKADVCLPIEVAEKQNGAPLEPEPVPEAAIVEADSTSPDTSKKKGNLKSAEEFPDTLEGFGYRFNDEGRLVNTADGESGFIFEVRPGDKTYNQKRYEALGEVIDEAVYKLLEERCGLKRHTIPFDAHGDEPTSFFFASEDALVNSDKLLVLVHGSGVVRAGQWARRLIINEGLDQGTQIPFIERALKLNYAVVVLNTNYRGPGFANFKIRGSSSPDAHANYVWRHFISTSSAKRIAIVAHSAGGFVTTSVAKDHEQDFLTKVFAVAFTDAFPGALSAHLKSHFRKITVNWVTSEKPLNTILYGGTDCERRSAGTTVHEWTSYAAFDSIFKFLDERYKAVAGKRSSSATPEKHKVRRKSVETNDVDSAHSASAAAVNGSKHNSEDPDIPEGTAESISA